MTKVILNLQVPEDSQFVPKLHLCFRGKPFAPPPSHALLQSREVLSCQHLYHFRLRPPRTWVLTPSPSWAVCPHPHRAKRNPQTADHTCLYTEKRSEWWQRRYYITEVTRHPSSSRAGREGSIIFQLALQTFLLNSSGAPETIPPSGKMTSLAL